jgi:mono/diheme cytochrome c family protein
MRYFLLGLVLCVVAVVSLFGFRGDLSRRPPYEIFPDMDRQPKLRPQAASKFFADGLGSRLTVAGTVARGERYEDTPAHTGRLPGMTNWVATIPLPVTEKLMHRGRERYGIYCAPCHGALGDGKGITGKYGMAAVANFHDKRLVEMTDGEIFSTIIHGKNLMGPYASQVPIEDRWAIIAYVRALQRSRLARLEDVPAGERSRLPPPPPPGAPAAAPQPGAPAAAPSPGAPATNPPPAAPAPTPKK